MDLISPAGSCWKTCHLHSSNDEEESLSSLSVTILMENIPNSLLKGERYHMNSLTLVVDLEQN